MILVSHKLPETTLLEIILKCYFKDTLGKTIPGKNVPVPVEACTFNTHNEPPPQYKICLCCGPEIKV